MEGVFQFLFKYRPILFREGDVVFGTSWPLGLVVGVAAALGIAAVVSYGSAKGKATPGERTLLGTLRLAALGVLAFALLQPTLLLQSVVPQRNFVGILLDDSRSMNLPDQDGAPRSDWVRATFGSRSSELVEALGERFALRFFRFSSETGRVESADELRFDGTRTDLAGALDRARGELSSVPLSGLVVVSDGADNGGTALAEALVPLQASATPVYTVGVGAEALSPDVQVSRVEVPRTVLNGTGTLVDVVLDHRGLRGRTVELLVEDGSRILSREEVELQGDGEPTLVRVPLTLDEAGSRILRFRVPVLDGEAVPENNARERVVDVTDATEKVLYFEGEPRDEVGFLRRAVDGDDNLQVVVLQRTAPDKFLRLDVDGPDELLGGFPRTREELFRYRGLILGSVEASFFTRDQLEMLADFVGDRGGGLLFLGGRNSFAEGGFTGTAVEDVLPVYLEEPAPDPRAAFTEVFVRPTPAGLNHPIGRLGDEGWDDLPPLSSLNRIVRAKPGATILLAGDTEDGDERAVLTHHRYGRGKALAFPVQDTWMWQMHADIPVEDMRHETLWRQLLRWLVDGVPEPVSVTLDPERAEIGESVELLSTVFDSAYIGVNDARVVATVTSPSGATLERPMAWAVDQDGSYAGAFVPTEDGTWQVTVRAETDEGLLGTRTSVLEVGPSPEEYFDAGRRTPLLQRVAEETGGLFYTRDDVDRLPEDLRFTGAGVTVTEARELWDMPVIFLLLIGLLGAEWGVRRMRGFV
ncbi:MAG TPA: glutamine amidotransferase [Longimicrobiales bacterium]|nr:glutamine amidotransferase [Longimicrobiales bacterium]